MPLQWAPWLLCHSDTGSTPPEVARRVTLGPASERPCVNPTRELAPAMACKARRRGEYAMGAG